jgi:hypothetical protein
MAASDIAKRDPAVQEAKSAGKDVTDAKKEILSALSNNKDVDLSSINPDDLLTTAAAAEKALQASNLAQKLRSMAASVADPEKRNQLLKDAYNKEVEAHGNSKKARMLTSGAFQGGVGGAGIGAGVAAGVGTVVGTLVGGVAAIPTTGLGALVGGGVGACHGPWIKLPKLGGDGKEGEKDGKDGGKDKGEKKDSKEEDQQGEGDAAGEGDKQELSEEDLEGVMPDPEALRKAAEELTQANQKKQGGDSEQTKQGKSSGVANGKGQAKEKKKPRKLEVRSKPQGEKND